MFGNGIHFLVHFLFILKREEEKPHCLPLPHSPLHPPLPHSQNHHNNHKDHPLIGKIEHLRKIERDDFISFHSLFNFIKFFSSHLSQNKIHLHLFHHLFHHHFFISHFET